MNEPMQKRRRFLKTGLALPLLGSLAMNVQRVWATLHDSLLVPQNIHEKLFMLYGGQANVITKSEKIKLKTPEIAENGAVVPITISGEKGLVSSIAIFASNNPNPLCSVCTFRANTDLAFSVRVKIGKTSEIYAIAETDAGLIGVKQLVKITTGCMGG